MGKVKTLGRPTRPLISRERAARAALSVIDIHGIEAFSLELVARKMGVKAPSLYYHFNDKAELLAEAARLILVDVELPEEQPDDWESSQVAVAVAARRSILQHPNAAPLLLQFFPRRLLLAAYDRRYSTCPYPEDQLLIVIEGAEKLTFGSALFEASSRSRGVDPMPNFDPEKLPTLAKAIRSNRLNDEELFIETLRRFFASFRMTDTPTAPAKTTKSRARKTADKVESGEAD